MSITISEMQKQVHNLAREKGWWPLDSEYSETGGIDASKVNIPEKLMLMVSELAEALEEYRNSIPLDVVYWINEKGEKMLYHSYDEALEGAQKGQKPEGFGIELADDCIRNMDTCGAFNLNLEGLIKLKHAYNKTRPHRHGGKKC